MTEEKNNISEKLEKESFDLFTKLQKLAVLRRMKNELECGSKGKL